jgi:hypothetical protein
MQILSFTLPKFMIEIPIPKTIVILSPPTKEDYYRIIVAKEKAPLAAEIMEKYADHSVPLLYGMAESFVNEYMRQINEYRESCMDYLKIPGSSDFTVDVPDKLPVMTYGENAVYTYSGIDFIRQKDINIIEYWMILADSLKARISQTKEGREYLDECWHDMHRVNTM